MQHIDTRSFEGFFDVVAGTARSQAAVMILEPGKSTGGADNRHERSDQWLYVTSGHGRATVEGETVELSPGSLIVIEAGEAHEIENAGGEPIRTVSVYAPPAY